VLFVPRVAVLRSLMRTSGAAASALGAASAAHGPLEAGARLFGNARTRGRLSLTRKRSFRGLLEFFVSFGMFFAVFLTVLTFLPLRVRFYATFSMFRRRFRGQRFVMHFVGKGLGFLRRVLVILIGVQRFLQLFQFGGLYIRFSHGFDCLRPLFGIGLRFFVLGLGKLFGKRAYIFLGKT